ncbi:hypothetical protein DPMN_031962 [Dreissena polymorpha]|uniref:Uncharacterized protein n=1 Tax=Dreissena polymorpha TaxID=45954 RepID=A0A9D4M1Z5_DREPO|nr:hypothetical protein DPMN_031962 [Dreissena polymorpha]
MRIHPETASITTTTTMTPTHGTARSDAISGCVVSTINQLMNCHRVTQRELDRVLREQKIRT